MEFKKIIFLTSFFLSGIATLIYEIVWTRPLSLIFGSTVYAFSTMLTSFMTGLALGSFISSKYADRLKKPLYTISIIEIWIGIYGILIIALFNLLPYPYLWIWTKLGVNFAVFNFLQFLLCFIVLIIPTTLIGAVWPIANKVYITDLEKIGKRSGVLYTISSCGAIIGAWIAGFVLIPHLGIKGSSIFAAFVNLFAGFLLLCLNKKEKEQEHAS